MSRTVEIVTPEQVAIRYELAGFGSRGLAAGIDGLLQGVIYVILLLLALLVWWLIKGMQPLFSWEDLGLSSSFLIGLLIISFFLVFWVYFIAFETCWNGETPGKRWMGLRVIKAGGYPVDARAVIIRNLLRAIDMLPASSYGIAFVSVLCTAQYQRLGDIAAGTQVVRHARRDEGFTPASTFGDAVIYRLLDTAVISQVFRFSRDEYRTVQQFLDRRHGLPQPLRGEFAHRLALPLMEKFAYQPPALGMDYERWLEELCLAYRQRTLGESTPAPSIPATATIPRTNRW